MAEDDKIWICCTPASEAKPVTAVATVPCKACNIDVWIAASTVEIMTLQSDRAWPVCLPCFVAALENRPQDGEPLKIYATPAQEHEVQSVLGKSAIQGWAEIGVHVEMSDPKDIP